MACRLCLEEVGVIQIVPFVKMQIKYCFDIVVDPFDGMPQLICKKCELLLREYYSTKQTLLTKQEKLKTSLEHKVLNNINKQHISNNNFIDCGNQQHSIFSKFEQKPRKRKFRRILSCTSPEEYDDVENKEHANNCAALEINHTKYLRKLACRFCAGIFNNVEQITNHLQSHSKLRTQYQECGAAHCQIKLSRIDTPDVLDLSIRNTVFLHSNKIIENKEHGFYYITYVKETDDKERCDLAEFSDSENVDKAKRRLRVLSNETVVLTQRDKTPELTDTEERSKQKKVSQSDFTKFIKIDDSSSDSNNSTIKKQKEYIVTNTDLKNIEILIEVCMNRHKKSLITCGQQNLKANLKHKVLSIGRKVITKQVTHFTGILRFLEHKNLKLDWIPCQERLPGKDVNFVRINTKLKGKEKPRTLGWTNLFHEVDYHQKVKLIKNLENIIMFDETKEIVKFNTIKEKSASVSKKATLLKSNIYNKTVSYLPNASGVNNIKNTANIENEIQVSTELTMPIITSSESLAVLNTPIELNQVCKNNMPLLQTRVEPGPEPKLNTNLISCNKSNGYGSQQHILRVTSPNIEIPSSVSNNSKAPHKPAEGFSPKLQENTSVTNQLTTQSRDKSNKSVIKYVILDTAEFPNQKTESPFTYFKNLLQMHGIHLVDSNESKLSDFDCLLKFKLEFQHSNLSVVDQPVILCLSLLCATNRFCIKVRDKNQGDIDINKLNAQWQWEILKSYKGVVENKVLTNAENKGQDYYEYTKNFIYLLKSIDYKVEE